MYSNPEAALELVVANGSFLAGNAKAVLMEIRVVRLEYLQRT
jgi:hypothetical protein